MQLDKKKILFSSLLLIVFIYLASYTYNVVTAEDEAPQLTRPDLPKWQETEKNFESKKEALDAFKKENETTPPSLYDEHMVDDKGYFNPDYMLYEKHRIIDSIYQSQNFQQRNPKVYYSSSSDSIVRSSPKIDEKDTIETHRNPDEIGLEHQEFFAVNPKFRLANIPTIQVTVLGDQVLRKDSRIQLQLIHDVILKDKTFPKHTVVWGSVSFGPNRVLVTVTHIHHQPIAFQAIDQQDGMLGIYIENSFRSEVSREVLDDAVQGVNIPGLPQVNGLKQVFQRRNRTIKVTVLDGYELLLKAKNL